MEEDVSPGLPKSTPERFVAELHLGDPHVHDHRHSQQQQQHPAPDHDLSTDPATQYHHGHLSWHVC